MNVHNITSAYYALNALKELERLTDLVEGGQGLQVTIQSHYQSDEFVAKVRPSVVAAMKEQQEELKQKLKELGAEWEE
ncbi:hypothetical protein [Citrobacter sp.]|uniref:hypothetical protein n=1 Tax=Citrobacter sp. TaxID=1896336 RepID=UPI002FCC4EC2